MTRVCLLGDPDVNLTYELLSRETARDALATYEIEEPFENSVAVDTVSLGAAVSLLNDLQLVPRPLRRRGARSRAIGLPRRVALSRPRPRGARRRRPPEETDQRLKVFGLVDGRPVEPLYVRRTQGETPEYDLRDVDETVIVRVSESEFSG